MTSKNLSKFEQLMYLLYKISLMQMKMQAKSQNTGNIQSNAICDLIIRTIITPANQNDRSRNIIQEYNINRATRTKILIIIIIRNDNKQFHTYIKSLNSWNSYVSPILCSEKKSLIFFLCYKKTHQTNITIYGYLSCKETPPAINSTNAKNRMLRGNRGFPKVDIRSVHSYLEESS